VPSSALRRLHWPRNQVYCSPSKSYVIVNVEDQAVAWCPCQVILSIALPSHDGDGVAEATLAMTRYCYRVMLVMRCWVMLAMVLTKRLGHDSMQMSSHADDGVAESCWWWCCRGDLVMARYRCWVILAMVLPSHASDGVAEATWLWHDVNVESCWRWCYRGDLTAVRCRCRVMLRWCYRVMLAMVPPRRVIRRIIHSVGPDRSPRA
jgi:hypothetical protein